MLPLLALVPLFNLWFGNTETAAILFVGLVTFCVIFAVALSAIANVPEYFVQYAGSLGASPIRTYWAVILPAALRRILVGVLLAHGFAWGAVIAAEFLGMQFGIGRVAQIVAAVQSVQSSDRGRLHHRDALRDDLRSSCAPMRLNRQVEMK
jgi:ABC-type nitrate/sulfonate/bicarbonate transport system permease component